MTVTTYVNAGTYTWVAPFTGSLAVECWGAGGGGGGAGSNFSADGGGGGGGEYSAELSDSVTAGNTYTIVVGAGGAAGTSSGGTGGTGANSTFTGTGATTVTGHGGAGGGGVSTGFGAGGAGGSGSTNTTQNSGGKGNQVTTSGNGGGGGGGSGGTASAGNGNGSSHTGNTAVTGGGAGGSGAPAAAGAVGGSPGGGGGGGEGVSHAGAAGAAGQVQLTYTTPAFPWVIQTITATATNTTGALTYSFGAKTTAGNTVLVFHGARTSVANAPFGNTCTLGGSSDHFSMNVGYSLEQAADFLLNAYLFEDPNCAGGQTAIVSNIFSSAATYWNTAVAYEVGGLPNPLVDDSAGWMNGTGTGTSFSSTNDIGGSYSLSSKEISFGQVMIESSSITITPPSSPWVSIPSLTISSEVSFRAGYNIFTGTQGTSLSYYAGTLSSSVKWAMAGITYAVPATLSSQPVIALQAVKRAAYY